MESHLPDEEEWQLLDQPMSREEFEMRVFKTSTFFTLGLKLIQPQHFHMQTGGPPASGTGWFHSTPGPSSETLQESQEAERA